MSQRMSKKTVKSKRMKRRKKSTTKNRERAKSGPKEELERQKTVN